MPVTHVALREYLKRRSRNSAIAHVNEILLQELRSVKIKEYTDASKAELKKLRKLLWAHVGLEDDATDSDFVEGLSDTLYGTVIGSTLFLSDDAGVDFAAHELLHLVRARMYPTVHRWANETNPAAEDFEITVREEQLCFLHQHMHRDGRSNPGSSAMRYVRDRLINGGYVNSATYDKHKSTSSELLRILADM